MEPDLADDLDCQVAVIGGGINGMSTALRLAERGQDVSLAAVCGVPHDSHGEEIKAFVVLERDADRTADELVAWGKEQLTSYKYRASSSSCRPCR